MLACKKKTNRKHWNKPQWERRGAINLHQKSFIMVWATTERRDDWGYFLLYVMIQLLLGSDAHMPKNVSDTTAVLT